MCCCTVVVTLQIPNIWVGYSPCFSFFHVHHTGENMENLDSLPLCLCPLVLDTSESKQPPPNSGLDLSENSLISLQKSCNLPTSLWDEDNTLFLSLFLGLTENFSRQSCPGCVCAEKFSQWIGSSAPGTSALLQCRLIYIFFPLLSFL